MNLEFQEDRGERTPEHTTRFSGKGFDCTSSSLGIFAALVPGRRVVGSTHPGHRARGLVVLCWWMWQREGQVRQLIWCFVAY